MNEIRQLVLKLLRMGNTPVQVCDLLADVEAELRISADYIQAIKDSDFRP